MATFTLKHNHRIHVATRTMFELGECENCSEPIQEANSLRLTRRSALDMVLAGVHVVDNLPPEIWYSEEKGHTVCDHCGGDYE